MGIEERQRGDRVHGELAAGVEAEPAEPQQAGPERDEGNVVRQLVLDPALADVQDRGERGDPGDGVDDDAAGEVEDAPLLQQPAAPDHVDEGEVDEEQPEREEDQVGLEADAVGEGPGDQRGGDDREHHLEDHEDQHGNGRVGGAGVVGEMPRSMTWSRLPMMPPTIAGEAERVANGVPEDGRPAHRDEALDHDGDDVLAADQAAVEERQRRRHQQDERARHQHERGVSGVEMWHVSPCGSRLDGPSPERAAKLGHFGAGFNSGAPPAPRWNVGANGDSGVGWALAPPP